jgi:hypothetical protein
VYGDKGVTPYYYMLTSILLQISGASALVESLESSESSPPGPKGKEMQRPELRRMCATVNIFIYVRLYALVRGAGGYLRPQKYALATLVAGTTMLPVAWARGIFPAAFWGMLLYNYRTAAETIRLSQKYGIDGAAARQARSTRKLYR